MEALSTISSMVSAFAARVDRRGPRDCWPWRGNISPEGYGRFTFRQRTVQAHRLAFALAHGHWPSSDGATDHLCRNRACVNPDHLEETTRGENVRRGLSGPRPWTLTHCKRGHPFDEANTYISQDGLHRACRACRAIRQRPINARNRRRPT